MAKKGAKKNKATATKTTGRTATATVPEPVIVRISCAGLALDQVAHVTNGQDVKWIAQDGCGPWWVTFPSSPFSSKKYKVPIGPGGRQTTGGADGTVGQRYGYTVMDVDEQITDKAPAVVIV